MWSVTEKRKEGLDKWKNTVCSQTEDSIKIELSLIYKYAQPYKYTWDLLFS